MQPDFEQPTQEITTFERPVSTADLQLVISLLRVRYGKTAGIAAVAGEKGKVHIEILPFEGTWEECTPEFKTLLQNNAAHLLQITPDRIDICIPPIGESRVEARAMREFYQEETQRRLQNALGDERDVSTMPCKKTEPAPCDLALMTRCIQDLWPTAEVHTNANAVSFSLRGPNNLLFHAAIIPYADHVRVSGGLEIPWNGEETLPNRSALIHTITEKLQQAGWRMSGAAEISQPNQTQDGWLAWGIGKSTTISDLFAVLRECEKSMLAA